MLRLRHTLLLPSQNLPYIWHLIYRRSSLTPEATVHMPVNTQGLIENIRTLRPELLVDVEDFVDFLQPREQEGGLSRAAAAMSASGFAAICNNPAAEVYDAL
jgi:hypothetical protein